MVRPPALPTRGLIPALAALLAAGLLGGCGAERQAEQMLEQARAGDLGKAAATASELRSADRDELVREMELGMLAHLAGDFAGSNRHFERAVPLVDERRQGSFTGAVGSWVLNDTVAPYAGRAYEHIQVDYYRCLNHLLMAGALDQAWAPGAPLRAGVPVAAPPAAADALQAVDHRERAVIAGRHMTLSGLKSTKDEHGGERYDDDPFARVLASVAVLGLPRGERTASDEQFVTAMLDTAVRAYAAQHARLGKDQPFRYEAAARPSLVATLWLRHLRGYDPERFQAESARAGLDAAAVELKEGHGSLLVLDHVGFITRPEPLQIALIAAGQSPPPGSSSFHLGVLSFYAKGPGAEIVNSWVAIPVPGQLVQEALAPGGAAVVGFEIPVHRPDRPLGARGELRVDGAAGRPLEVVCDLDAYARAALKDDQPHLLIRTLTRVLAKQGAVAVASKATRDSKKGSADTLALLVNLIGSTVMTLSESADLRAWLTLPDHVEGALVDLPAGRHRLAIAGRGATIDLGEVVVAEGRTTVIALRSFTPETEMQKDKP